MVCIETIDTRLSNTDDERGAEIYSVVGTAELHAGMKLAACCSKRREFVVDKVSLSNLSIASADILRLPREILAAYATCSYFGPCRSYR